MILNVKSEGEMVCLFGPLSPPKREILLTIEQAFAFMAKLDEPESLANFKIDIDEAISRAQKCRNRQNDLRNKIEAMEKQIAELRKQL